MLREKNVRSLTNRLNEDATRSFESSKQAMAQLPVLALPGFNQLFVIEAHATRFGIGAYLMQNNIVKY